MVCCCESRAQEQAASPHLKQKVAPHLQAMRAQPSESSTTRLHEGHFRRIPSSIIFAISGSDDWTDWRCLEWSADASATKCSWSSGASLSMSSPWRRLVHLSLGHLMTAVESVIWLSIHECRHSLQKACMHACVSASALETACARSTSSNMQMEHVPVAGMEVEDAEKEDETVGAVVGAEVVAAVDEVEDELRVEEVDLWAVLPAAGAEAVVGAASVAGFSAEAASEARTCAELCAELFGEAALIGLAERELDVVSGSSPVPAPSGETERPARWCASER